MKRGRPLYEGVDWNAVRGHSYVTRIQSPSLRGRGLKLCVLCKVHIFSLCRPLYEGVDWNTNADLLACDLGSRPLYEGVDWNNMGSMHLDGISIVALFTRAWIEIGRTTNSTNPIKVALFTRAWIEIYFWYMFSIDNISSPSLRGRGLKYPQTVPKPAVTESPSLRGRGLKCRRRGRSDIRGESPSLRGRGLKLSKKSVKILRQSVALFTRAWIEIPTKVTSILTSAVALFTRAWIEIP